MHMCEQGRLHCTSHWEQQTLLSELVYCVAVTFKMTERVEQRICIQFCVKLEHSSTETIRMTQKAAAMATGDWQLHHDNAPAHASRLVQSLSLIHI